MKAQARKLNTSQSMSSQKQLWATIPENSQAQISGGGLTGEKRNSAPIAVIFSW